MRARASASSALPMSAREAWRYTEPSSSATASMEPIPSVWAMSAFMHRATWGAAIAAIRAISPGALLPHSTTIARCARVSPRSVKGAPTRLLRLPTVAWQGPSTAAASAAAVSSLVVVLPTAPLMATTGMSPRVRSAWARGDGAERDEGVVHFERGDAVGELRPAPHQHRAGALRERGAEVLVAVEALPLEGDEEAALVQRAGVGGEALQREVRSSAEGGAGVARQAGEREGDLDAWQRGGHRGWRTRYRKSRGDARLRRVNGRSVSRSRSGRRRRGGALFAAMSSERRAYTRVPVDLWVEERHEGVTYFQRATNLSLGGLYLDRTLPHPPGTRVHLAVKLGALDVDLTGEIVGAANDTGMNVRFIDLDRTQRALIADFLLSLHARTGT